MARTSGSTAPAPAARIAVAATVSVQPLATWSSTSRTVAPGGNVGVQPAATTYGGDALRRVGLAGPRRDGVVADRPGADERDLHDARQAVGEVADQGGPGGGLDDDDGVGARGPLGRPVLHHVHDRLGEARRDRTVGGVLAEQRAQRLAVAEVGEAGDGTTGLGARGDLALEVEAEVGQRRRPHPPRLERDAGAGQPLAGLGHGGLAHRRRQGRARRSCRSGRSRSALGVVELLAEVAHPALGGRAGSRASPAARARGPRRRGRSARRRSSRVARSRPSRPATRCTAPSTSSTLSIDSSRLRPSSTRVSRVGGRQRPFASRRGQPASRAPAPRGGSRARRSRPRCRGPRSGAAGRRSRRRCRDRHGRPAGSRRPATAARRG